RCPELGDRAPKRVRRARVFQQPECSAGLENALDLSESRCLLLVRQNAKQKCRDRIVEMLVRKFKLCDVHLAQLDLSAGLVQSRPRGRQHGRTDIDPDDVRADGIELKIPPSPDTGIENPACHAFEQQWPELAVASVFEREIEYIIKRRDALISLAGGVIVHSRTCLSLRALLMTLTEDSAIAAAAMIGESRIPNHG